MKRITRASLPLAADLRPYEERGLTLAFCLLLAMLAGTAANAIFGIGGNAWVKPIRDWVSSAIYIVVAVIVAGRVIKSRTKRIPWAVFAVGLSLYGLGNVLWSLWIEHLQNVPIPSICDGLWLTL